MKSKVLARWQRAERSPGQVSEYCGQMVQHPDEYEELSDGVITRADVLDSVKWAFPACERLAAYKAIVRDIRAWKENGESWRAELWRNGRTGVDCGEFV